MMAYRLPQRRPDNGAVLLRDYGREVVRVACPACGREGRYGLAGLVDRFGPAAALPDVLAELAGDCPRRGAGRFSDPCAASFPDLSRG